MQANLRVRPVCYAVEMEGGSTPIRTEVGGHPMALRSIDRPGIEDRIITARPRRSDFDELAEVDWIPEHTDHLLRHPSAANDHLAGPLRIPMLRPPTEMIDPPGRGRRCGLGAHSD